MSSDVMQDVIYFVFNNLFPYVLPVLFLFMTALFSERLIDILANAFLASTRRRR